MKWFSEINFKTVKSIDDLYLIDMYKSETEYDKPIYVGTSVLDFSTLHMMKFHYEIVAEHFDTYNLIYSDTDSFVYDIPCDDILINIYI